MASKPSEQEAFARKVLAELRKLLPGDTFEYDAECFRLIVRTRQNAHINLNPTHERYQAAPFWKRSGVLISRLRNIASSLDGGDFNSDAVRSLLMPKVRERIDIEIFRLRGLAGDRAPIPFAYVPVAEHLTLEVSLRLSGGIRSVSAEDLSEWGIPFEEALTIANQNVLQYGVDQFREVQRGVFISTWNDDFDGSRIHLPEILGNVRVKGRPVAMIPNRNTLIVSGADDDAGLVTMAQIAGDVLQQPGAMSGMAFRLDATLTHFLPEPDSPAYIPLQRLSVETLATYYGKQTNALLMLDKTQGVDRFVASPIVVTSTATGKRSTVGTWSEGLDTLLPRTDSVAFLQRIPNSPEANPLGRLGWDTVSRVLGDRMELAEGYPARWRVRSFPSAEEIAELSWMPLRSEG